MHELIDPPVAIRQSDPDQRRAIRQDLSRPTVDAFFAWLKAQAARVSRKSDLGEAIAYMLKSQVASGCSLRMAASTVL